MGEKKFERYCFYVSHGKAKERLTFYFSFLLSKSVIVVSQQHSAPTSLYFCKLVLQFKKDIFILKIRKRLFEEESDIKRKVSLHF
jgi:hypothetical protein